MPTGRNTVRTAAKPVKRIVNQCNSGRRPRTAGRPRLAVRKRGPAANMVRRRFSCSSRRDGGFTVLPMRIAIYPGSFDPLTNGHLDVIQRATKLFDRIIVAAAKSESKNPLFDLEERTEMVRQSIGHLPTVEVDSFDGLLVEYVERRGAQAVIRGLRAVSDFEFEFQLALMNRKLNERIETIFMMPKDTYTFLSSKIVKEIARLGGDVSAFVPAHVRAALTDKLVHASV
jgi:pantetheine-phosphate adenylyltransferase